MATDSNPGTSPVTSLLMIMSTPATLFGFTVDEAIAGVTREAARALGRLREIGTLEAEKCCDLAGGREAVSTSIPACASRPAQGAG